jgi:hypothetical protein
MSASEIQSGEMVIVEVDGRVEMATFLKISGAGNRVVRYADGATVALYPNDLMGRELRLDGRLHLL